jgi:hypothetical protein
MPESPNQATSRQRRANWVGLRTLRQVPKVVGEMADGETVYEVKSVRLVLDGSGGHFVRVTSCSRCGRELPGTPVLTPLDLERPLRPMICSECIRQAGVSTVWDSEGAEPGGLGPSADPAPAPAPAPAAGDPVVVDKQVERLDLMERHLRAMTDRVNELGRVARAQQVEGKARAEQDDAAATALRSELASVRAALEEVGRRQEERAEALRAAVDETRAWAQDTRSEIEAAIAEMRAPGPDAGAEGDVTGLAQRLEAQSAELARIAAAVVESRTVVEASTGATRELARAHDALDRRLSEAAARFGALQVDATSVDAALTTRVAEAEERLSQRIAGQWGDLETAIESSVTASVAGIVRAQEELAGGQAVLKARLGALAGQLAQVSNRMDSLVQRLASPPPAEPEPALAPGGDFLDALDRQLDAAARRLAARSAGSVER